MTETIFKQLGGAYTQQDEYQLQNLTLPSGKEKLMDVWPQHRQRYLKQHRKVQYYNFCLADTEEQSQ